MLNAFQSMLNDEDPNNIPSSSTQGPYLDMPDACHVNTNDSSSCGKFCFGTYCEAGAPNCRNYCGCRDIDKPCAAKCHDKFKSICKRYCDHFCHYPEPSPNCEAYCWKWRSEWGEFSRVSVGLNDYNQTIKKKCYGNKGCDACAIGCYQAGDRRRHPGGLNWKTDLRINGEKIGREFGAKTFC